jgi:hypothetical protein
MKFLVSFHFGILWNYVSELFDTRLRTFALGFSLTLGLIFQALGTYEVLLAKALHIHPLVVPFPFILLSLLSAIYAPETKGQGIRM